MDILDGYKKAWENQPEEQRKISKVDIYKMSHSKSSSIVKWIFIVGVLELLFWAGLNIYTATLLPEGAYKELHLDKLVQITTYLHYVVIVLFLFLFYKNYHSISVSDNTKKLIGKILRVRKTVKYYVYFNLTYGILVQIIAICFMLSDMDLLVTFYENHGIEIGDNKKGLFLSLVISSSVLILLMFVILWLFYKLVYGGLVKKLNVNYKELIKLEKES